MGRARKEECFQIDNSDNWYFNLYVEGRRRRVSTGTREKVRAEKIRQQKQDEQSRAAVSGTEKALTFTFGEACGYYAKANKDGRFMGPLLNLWENTLVRDVTPGVIKQASIDLHPDGKPATRIRQVITPASAIINHCAELGKCAPIRIRRPKVSRVPKEAVERDYIDAMIAAAPVPQIAALILFMYSTGSRIGIATALTMSDHVDLKQATVTYGKDKNGDPHSVHLVEELVAMIANLPRDGRNANKVFLYSSRHSVYGLLKRMATNAKYKYVPPHQVGRHSFASELFARGYSVADVMKLGNWKSSKMVLEIYAHSKIGRAEAINDVFGKPPSIGRVSTEGNVKPLRRKGSDRP